MNKIQCLGVKDRQIMTKNETFLNAEDNELLIQFIKDDGKFLMLLQLTVASV